MGIAKRFNECARLGGDHFTVTGAERFNQSTQLLACTVACGEGQAEVHVHFARMGNGIETGCNLRGVRGRPGEIWNFPAGASLAQRCIEYAKANQYVSFPH